MQVEYWALLEELRAAHSTVAAAGSSAVPPGPASSTSMQQLWQASVAAGAGPKSGQQHDDVSKVM